MASQTASLISGSIAASISTVLCHPIDVVRTELQVNRELLSARECVKRILKEEGPRGLFKGMSAPLAAQAVYKAVIFGVNTSSQSVLLSRKRPRASGEPASLSYGELFGCGTLAGAVNSFIVTPVELVRNRLVTARGKYGGPADCLRHILASDGPAGLFRGLVPTLWRDGPGVGAWFLAFAWSKDRARAWRQRQGLDDRLDLKDLLLGGSLAGIAFWAVALPFDTVKSVVQVSTLRGAEREGMLSAGRRLVREGGVLRLFRGWQGAIGRAIPGSAVTLATFDLVKDMLAAPTEQPR